MTLRIGYVIKAYLMQSLNALSGIKAKCKVKRQAIKDSCIEKWCNSDTLVAHTISISTFFMAKHSFNYIMVLHGLILLKLQGKASIQN